MISRWVIYNVSPRRCSELWIWISMLYTQGAVHGINQQRAHRRSLSPKAPRISNQKIRNAGVRYPGKVDQTEIRVMSSEGRGPFTWTQGYAPKQRKARMWKETRKMEKKNHMIRNVRQGIITNKAYYQLRDRKYTCRRRRRKTTYKSTICQAAARDTFENAQKELVRPIAHPVHGIITR